MQLTGSTNSRPPAHTTPTHNQQSFLKDNKYDAWLDVSADADPKRLLQKAQLVISSGACLCVCVCNCVGGDWLDRTVHMPTH